MLQTHTHVAKLILKIINTAMGANLFTLTHTFTHTRKQTHTHTHAHVVQQLTFPSTVWQGMGFNRVQVAKDVS